MFQHILVPTDGSALSDRAIRMGIDLAAACGARVTLLHCTTPYATFEADTLLPVTRAQYEAIAGGAATRILAGGLKYAQDKGVEVAAEHLVADPPHKAIVKAAGKLGCDLVVMASHGHHGAAAVLLGSETTKVLATAKVPVLVCR